MAIRWYNDKHEVVKVTHEGQVLTEGETRCVRVMSDIYSDETYCSVYNPTTGKTESVHINSCFELFQGPYGVAVPDLSDENRTAWDAVLAEQAKVHEEQRRLAALEEAERQWNAPTKGKSMLVHKGRKVPRGTEGTVIWVGEGRYGGLRVGLKDATGTVHWTAASNVTNSSPYLSTAAA